METPAVPADLLERTYVYSPRLYATECELRVRIEQGGAHGAVRVVGPFTPYQRTVPEVYSSTEFRKLSETLGEYRILIPEPCFWTPNAPFLYRLDISLPREEGTDGSLAGSLWVGLRHLVTEEGLRLTGQPWHPRGALLTAQAAEGIVHGEETIEKLRALGLDLLVLDVPLREFAAACSESGLALFVVLPDSVPEIAAAVRRLRNEAAVLAWGLPEGGNVSPDFVQLIRTLDPVRPLFEMAFDRSAVVLAGKGGKVSLPVRAQLSVSQLLNDAAPLDLAPGSLVWVGPGVRE